MWLIPCAVVKGSQQFSPGSEALAETVRAVALSACMFVAHLRKHQVCSCEAVHKFVVLAAYM